LDKSYYIYKVKIYKEIIKQNNNMLDTALDEVTLILKQAEEDGYTRHEILWEKDDNI